MPPQTTWQMNNDILILAFGNPGRQDDGLGPRCAELLAAQNFPGVQIEINYQLTVEDALSISLANKVVFIDAAISLEGDYQFIPVDSCPDETLGSHLISPQGLLYLAESLFDSRPEAYLLAIKGVEFGEFNEELSVAAEKNLNQAFQFLQSQIDLWHQGAGGPLPVKEASNRA